jgi:hypothetical protein
LKAAATKTAAAAAAAPRTEPGGGGGGGEAAQQQQPGSRVTAEQQQQQGVWRRVEPAVVATRAELLGELQAAVSELVAEGTRECAAGSVRDEGGPQLRGGPRRRGAQLSRAGIGRQARAARGLQGREAAGSARGLARGQGPSKAGCEQRGVAARDEAGGATTTEAE